MAKIVVAGSAECPYYARVELLADALVQNLNDFKLHKVVVQPAEWKEWLSSTCKERGWQHARSPIIWRELVDRGGKGILIGGANEFQEYAKAYYNMKSTFTSDDMCKIAVENKNTKQEMDEELKQLWASSHPLNVCVTCASNSSAYNLITGITDGSALGQDTEIALRLHDSTEQQEALQGVAMEAQDLACPLLTSTLITDDLRTAFSGCKVIILLDELLYDMENESREEWLQRNYHQFNQYGQVIDEVADADVKVVVAGAGPLNFNTWALLHNNANIKRRNVVALARLVENSAKGLLSQRLSVNSADVVDVLVWGNINNTNYIDVSASRVHQYDGAIWGPPSFSRSVVEMVHDNKWISTEFIDSVSQRKHHIEQAMKHTASAAQASAVVSLLNHWTRGSPPGQVFSLGVMSEDWYDLPSDIVFSVPVSFDSSGEWHVKVDLDLDSEVKSKFAEIIKELQIEKDAILNPGSHDTPPLEKQDNEKVFGEAEITQDKEQPPQQEEEESAEPPPAEDEQTAVEDEQTPTEEAESPPEEAAEQTTEQAEEPPAEPAE